MQQYEWVQSNAVASMNASNNCLLRKRRRGGACRPCSFDMEQGRERWWSTASPTYVTGDSQTVTNIFISTNYILNLLISFYCSIGEPSRQAEKEPLLLAGQIATKLCLLQGPQIFMFDGFCPFSRHPAAPRRLQWRAAQFFADSAPPAG